MGHRTNDEKRADMDAFADFLAAGNDAEQYDPSE